MSKKVLITGGARGIGQSIAKLMKARGYEVLTPSREELSLDSLESIDAFFKTDRKVDILINNAGINFPAAIGDVQMDRWQEMMQVNLTAPMRLIQKVAPHMKKAKWGRIVNISSVLAHVAREGRAAYSATKAGLDGITRTAAIELAGSNILVNSVCPGYIETQLTHQNNPPEVLEKIVKTIPFGRLGKPEEIAELVEFLCSEKNAYITGQSIVADGGFSIQ